MYVMCFGGEFFYPEPDLKWRFDRPERPYVYPGRLYDWDGSELWKKYMATEGASRHMTNVFNVYVVMNIFNMINTRKISNELNIFAGITGNYIFLGVWLLIAGAQAVIIEFGSKALKVSQGGLPYQQWLVALGFGFGQWVVAWLIKWVPDRVIPRLGEQPVRKGDKG